MSLTRRHFLKLLAITSTCFISSVQAVSSYLPWPRAAFESNKLDVAFKTLFPIEKTSTNSAKIHVDITKNAKVSSPIAIKIHSNIEQTDSISLFLKKSSQPLLATFLIPEGTIASISTRIRLSQSDTLLVAVKAKNKVYSTQQEIPLLSGGCGE